MALRYAGIEFPYPRTEIHTMGPVRDPSGTDQLYTKIHLKARSVLNVQLLPATVADVNAQGLLARLRHHLTAPRKALYYDLLSLPGGTSATAPINIPDGIDDANGPWPDEEAFSAVYTTPATIEVTWAVTVCIRDCGDGLGSVDDPLSLRWEDSITWDKYWKATYQRAGTCIISSRSKFTVDAIRRNALAPIVPPGFHRTRAHYLCSKDGLRCDFNFMDEQLRFAPPYPAVEMEITQSESFPLVGGMRTGEVFVSLRGVQSANVRDLAMWAITISKARIWAATPLATQEGKVIGNTVIKSRESTDGVDVACASNYKIQPGQIQEQQSGDGPFSWSRGGAIGGGIIGGFIGGPIGAAIGSGIGYGIGALAGGAAQPTEEKRDPTKQPHFPWLGVGTSPQSPTNPAGYATWADPVGAITGPADGVGLAPAVSLFAALLNDPCGAELRSTPLADAHDVELRANPNGWNTSSLGGQGGTTSIQTNQLTAQLSSLAASQYPRVPTTGTETALYIWDGKPGVYDHWQAINEYLTDPGVIVMPTANPDGVNIAVRHSSKMITLRKRWSASRTGAKPNVPPQEHPDANWVFVGAYEGLPDIRVAPDGVSVKYQVDGIYEYQAIDPALVKKYTDAAPFLNAQALTEQKKWFDVIVELVTGLPFGNTGTGGTGGGSLSGGGSGTSLSGGTPSLGITGGSGSPILGSGEFGGVLTSGEPLTLNNLPISSLPIGGFTDLSGFNSGSVLGSNEMPTGF